MVAARRPSVATQVIALSLLVSPVACQAGDPDAAQRPAAAESSVRAGATRQDPDRAPALPTAPDQTIELGDIAWRHGGADFAAGRVEAKESGKPMFVLFQEIPGCATCRNFGEAVLSHPLLVEAAETLFVPVAVRNNTTGDADAAVRERYQEPSWNNPVVRLLDAEGEDLVGRVSGRWTLGAVAGAMHEALQKADRPVPAWFAALVEEATARERGVRTAVFAMYCFWTGEVALAGVPGVVSTRAAWHDGHEVVEVVYDPSRVEYETLVEKAGQQRCADTVYWTTPEQRAVAERLAPGKSAQLIGRPRPDRDPKHSLRGTELRHVPLTPLQAARSNRALAGHRGGIDPAAWLSPRQRALLNRVRAQREAGWPEVTDEPLVTAWAKVAAFERELAERADTKSGAKHDAGAPGK